MGEKTFFSFAFFYFVNENFVFYFFYKKQIICIFYLFILTTIVWYLSIWLRDGTGFGVSIKNTHLLALFICQTKDVQTVKMLNILRLFNFLSIFVYLN